MNIKMTHEKVSFDLTECQNLFGKRCSPSPCFGLSILKWTIKFLYVHIFETGRNGTVKEKIGAAKNWYCCKINIHSYFFIFCLSNIWFSNGQKNVQCKYYDIPKKHVLRDRAHHFGMDASKFHFIQFGTQVSKYRNGSVTHNVLRKLISKRSAGRETATRRENKKYKNNWTWFHVICNGVVPWQNASEHLGEMNCNGIELRWRGWPLNFKYSIKIRNFNYICPLSAVHGSVYVCSSISRLTFISAKAIIFGRKKKWGRIETISHCFRLRNSKYLREKGQLLKHSELRCTNFQVNVKQSWNNIE